MLHCSQPNSRRLRGLDPSCTRTTLRSHFRGGRSPSDRAGRACKVTPENACMHGLPMQACSKRHHKALRTCSHGRLRTQRRAPILDHLPPAARSKQRSQGQRKDGCSTPDWPTAEGSKENIFHAQGVSHHFPRRSRSHPRIVHGPLSGAALRAPFSSSTTAQD